LIVLSVFSKWIHVAALRWSIQDAADSRFTWDVTDKCSPRRDRDCPLCRASFNDTSLSDEPRANRFSMLGQFSSPSQQILNQLQFQHQLYQTRTARQQVHHQFSNVAPPPPYQYQPTTNAANAGHFGLFDRGAVPLAGSDDPLPERPLLRERNVPSLPPKITWNSKFDCATNPTSTVPTNITALLSVTAPAFPENENPTELIGVDLVACVDVSGSMSGAKLESAKSTLHYISKNLGPRDRLCLIEFDTSARQISRFHICNDGSIGLAKISAAITAIKARGGTAINTAVSLALDTMDARATQNDAAAVILLSDGQDSFPFDYTHLLDRAKKSKIPFFTYGFGDDHDARLLALLAGGSGNFTFVKRVEEFEEAFAGCLGGVKTTMYRNLELKICTNGVADINDLRIKITSVKSSYPFVITEETATITYGDLFAEESRDILVDFCVELISGNEASVGSQSIANVECKYLDIFSGNSKNQDGPELSLPMVLFLPENAVWNWLVTREILRFLTMQAMKNALEKAERGDFSSSLVGFAETTREFAAIVQLAYKLDENTTSDLLLSQIESCSVNTSEIPAEHTICFSALLKDLKACESRCKNRASFQMGMATQYQMQQTYVSQRATHTSIFSGESSNLQTTWGYQGRNSSIMQKSSHGQKSGQGHH
ncbi:hypothetical protein HK100_010100, partial [Physocladia obscura]